MMKAAMTRTEKLENRRCNIKSLTFNKPARTRAADGGKVDPSADPYCLGTKPNTSIRAAIFTKYDAAAEEYDSMHIYCRPINENAAFYVETRHG